jgi:hypothetical protein
MPLTILHNQKGLNIQQEQKTAVKVTTDSLLATLGSLQPGDGRAEHITTNQQPWLMAITHIFIFLPSTPISAMIKHQQAACDMLAVGSAQHSHCSTCFRRNCMPVGKFDQHTLQSTP